MLGSKPFFFFFFSRQVPAKINDAKFITLCNGGTLAPMHHGNPSMRDILVLTLAYASVRPSRHGGRKRGVPIPKFKCEGTGTTMGN